MEKRIKILYVITIIAIFAFLGMQIYWLYGQYEVNLRESEDNMKERVLAVMSNYFTEREKMEKEKKDQRSKEKQLLYANYNVDWTINKKATLTIYKMSDQEYEEWKSVNTETEKDSTKAIFEVNMPRRNEVYKQSLDVTKAPTESYIWAALHNAQFEYFYPMNTAVLDSMLISAGIKAKISLIVTDSINWEPSLLRHKSIFNPTASITIPYSEMESKSLLIECYLSPFEVMGKMLNNLIAITLLSILLIICLIWQFSTVLKLNRLDQMRNGFITTMIHELKRPISTLKMCVSGIENDVMMDNREVRHELMGEARIALDNLSSYFSKLRDITFNDVEQIPLTLSIINVRESMNSVFKQLIFPENKKVEFLNNIPEDLEISVDRTHFMNILNNLLENAVKYSGESVSIIADAENADESVIIKLTDTGFGIPSNEIPYIFTRFYRGKQTYSDLPGMGLGLSYVRMLVEAHGGSVRASSKEGKGSCFTIILPQ